MLLSQLQWWSKLLPQTPTLYSKQNTVPHAGKVTTNNNKYTGKTTNTAVCLLSTSRVLCTYACALKWDPLSGDGESSCSASCTTSSTRSCSCPSMLSSSSCFSFCSTQHRGHKYSAQNIGGILYSAPNTAYSGPCTKHGKQWFMH